MWHRTSTLSRWTSANKYKILPTMVLINYISDTLVRVLESGLICRIDNHIRKRVTRGDSTVTAEIPIQRSISFPLMSL